jgi:hypothetical protein
MTTCVISPFRDGDSRRGCVMWECATHESFMKKRTRNKEPFVREISLNELTGRMLRR